MKGANKKKKATFGVFINVPGQTWSPTPVCRIPLSLIAHITSCSHLHTWIVMAGYSHLCDKMAWWQFPGILHCPYFLLISLWQNAFPRCGHTNTYSTPTVAWRGLPGRGTVKAAGHISPPTPVLDELLKLPQLIKGCNALFAMKGSRISAWFSSLSHPPLLSLIFPWECCHHIVKRPITHDMHRVPCVALTVDCPARPQANSNPQTPHPQVLFHPFTSDDFQQKPWMHREAKTHLLCMLSESLTHRNKKESVNVQNSYCFFPITALRGKVPTMVFLFYFIFEIQSSFKESAIW